MKDLEVTKENKIKTFTLSFSSLICADLYIKFPQITLKNMEFFIQLRCLNNNMFLKFYKLY